MTLTAYLFAFLAVVYIGWSILKIRCLLIENAALEHEADRLIWWVRRNEGQQPRVTLTNPEKRMILGALEADAFREQVTAPQTKRFIRDLYGALRVKIREANREYGG